MVAHEWVIIALALIGYDESKPPEPAFPILGPGDRGGSHNLVIGRWNRFTQAAFGGFVAGEANFITNEGASVSGGFTNTASGQDASVTGGQDNTASSDFASVTGGQGNTDSGGFASVSGGGLNNASGFTACVSGGFGNTASGYQASVSGGTSNLASVAGPASWVAITIRPAAFFPPLSLAVSATPPAALSRSRRSRLSHNFGIRKFRAAHFAQPDGAGVKRSPRSVTRLPSPLCLKWGICAWTMI